MSIDDFVCPTFVSDPRVGAVVQNRYRIVEKLSEGGMGVIYLAEHLMIKRKVAIKFLHSQYASNPAAAERFHREALAATSVGNEHIVEVFDMGYFDDGSLFMVLEFLQGRDFGEEIKSSGPLPLHRVVHIICQICDALTEAHAKGIVHRDLKPANIFLIRRGDDPDFVKILDFGISKFKTASQGTGARLTATGATIGTLHFMSPEQADDGYRIDHRSDIYALGSMMYYALTGRYAFAGTSLHALIMQIFTSEPRSIRELRPELPPDIEAIISKLMAKERERRYQDCAELKQALLPFRAPATQSLPLEIGEEPGPVESDAEVDGHVSVLEANPDSVGSVDEKALTMPASASDDAWRVHSVDRQKRALIDLNTTGLTVEVPKKSVRTPMAVSALLAVVAAIGSLVVFSVNSNDNIVERDKLQTLSKTASIKRVHSDITAGKYQKADSLEGVRIKIRTNPAKAQLFLDRSPIANPFDGELPKSNVVHAVHARLDGYQSVSQEFVLRFSQTITLQLKPRSKKTPDRVKRTKRIDSQTSSGQSDSIDSHNENRETVSNKPIEPSDPPRSTSPIPDHRPSPTSKGGADLKKLF